MSKLFTSRRNQRGVSLVIVLLFLVMLSILGTTAIQTSSLEEKMTGNERDRQIAFEAAEGALRDAEREIFQSLSPNSPFVSGCVDGLCVPSTTAVPQWEAVELAQRDAAAVRCLHRSRRIPGHGLGQHAALHHRALAADGAHVGQQRGHGRALVHDSRNSVPDHLPILSWRHSGRGCAISGYIDGKNIVVEYRFAGGQLNQFQTLSLKSSEVQVDILVSGILPAIRAAKETTSADPLLSWCFR